MDRVLAVFLVFLVLAPGCISNEPPISTTTQPSTSSSVCATTSTTFFFPMPTTSAPYSGRVPVVDGVDSGLEWSDAVSFELSGIDRLRYKVADGRLFIIYEALDKNRFYSESALFFDFDADGLFNYGYGYKPIFFVVPLFDEETKFYCGGHSSLRLPVMDCGRPYGFELKGLEREYVLGDTKVTSEVCVPIGEDLVPALNNSAYFFLIYGEPEHRCFPESMQCFEDPIFQRVSV